MRRPLILNYNMIGGLAYDIHPNFQHRVKEFITTMRESLKEYDDIFTGNVISKRVRRAWVCSARSK